MPRSSPASPGRIGSILLASLVLLPSCDVLGLGDDCEPNASPVFTHMFTDLSQVRAIVPLGTPSSGGEIKERHQVQLVIDRAATGATAGRNVPIMAPARAKLKSVRRFRATAPPAPCADDYYGFELAVSCEVTVRFDHIRTAGERLRAAVSGYSTAFEEPRGSTTFEAGDIIGHTDGTPPAPPGENRSFAFDYAVYNSTHENTFANMERYRRTSNLGNSLRSVCGGAYYTGSLRADFHAALGYEMRNAGGDCRAASRDVPGALVGGWFRPGVSGEPAGWRMAIATEFDGRIRMAVHPFTTYFFQPIRTTGSVNLDPALATGTAEYCYTDNTQEFWFRLSAGGSNLSMLQRSGRCLGPAPSSIPLQWER
ncbi:MAG: hypothetical protein L0271_17955 [Gemmatimonadetes bacterium]|nr:hypothetical protein [Gemmatimonadota bacterium]